jgi:hypothetical protein
LIDDGTFEASRHSRWGLQLAEGAEGVVRRFHDAHTLAAGTAIGLEHEGKTHTSDPQLEFARILEEFGSWDTDPFAGGQFHEGCPGIDQREALRGPQRTFEEPAEGRAGVAAVLGSLMNFVQLACGEVVTRDE